MKNLLTGMIALLGTTVILPAEERLDLKLAPTHETLSKSRSDVNSLADRLELEAIDPAKLTKPEPRSRKSLLARSQFLAFRGNWTMVPKGAVLHVPDTFKERVVARPKGELISWQEFYRKNRGWLQAQPVRLSDAKGDTPLAPSLFESFTRHGRVVVAVLHNGPISVLKASSESDRTSK